ncbi:MAG: cytochrome b/b6 domain-containing protein [Mariprofundus sp.]|nr:cytochrome b/b6 domain-containing protein [Mariprofundus sp.]
MQQTNTQPLDASGQGYHQLTRWLHAGLVLGVIFQLVCAALIVLANLLWAIIPRGNPRKRQFAVLFSALHWSEAISIAKRLPVVLAGKSPLPVPGNSLPLIVEMFGMLTMTAMAISGSIVWNMWAGPGSNVSEQAEFWVEMHAAIAVLLLLYLAGHVSMALMHLRAGDPVFARILPRLNGKT